MGTSTERAGAGPDALFLGVREDLARVEETIALALQADGPLTGEVAMHLLQGGGKRLRPALVLLAGAAAGGETAALIPVAAASEIIHMATLVHDDMVDGSELRRGVPTVHAKWGEAAGVLIGDYLFASGFSMLAATGNNRVVRAMSDVVSRMCAGEMRELAEQWQACDEDAYLQRIDAKTAYFIAECCRMGGIAAGAPARLEEALAGYGSAVGLSFQITDDLLDLTGTVAAMGKPAGADLRAGVVTLPVIHALHHAPEADEILSILASRRVDDGDVERVRDIAERAGSVVYARQRSAQLAREAQSHLAVLPPSRGRDTLAALAAYLVERSA
jgi:heptaprenyl diphosphate synthase